MLLKRQVFLQIVGGLFDRTSFLVFCFNLLQLAPSKNDYFTVVERSQNTKLIISPRKLRGYIFLKR